MTTRLLERAHVALVFDVLAHVDLEGDAGTLFRPGTSAPWAPALADALRGRVEAASLQALPLLNDDLSSTMGALQRAPLGDALARAVDAHERSFLAAWAVGRDKRVTRRAKVRDRVVGPLNTLRRALFGGSAPPLVVWDVPALGPRARAAALPDKRVVATSLAEAPDHLLCQIFHEEVHAATDPGVLKRFGGRPRSTLAGSEGFDVHQALESAAIERGEVVIAHALPDKIDAYRAWRARVGG